jgi:hypothetical protein
VLGLHPDLLRHTALAIFSSVVVGSVGVFMLVAGVVPLEATRGIPAWVLIVFGALFVLLAYAGVVWVPSWYRGASRVVASNQAVPGIARLRLDSSSDSTSLYARVVSPTHPESNRSDEVTLLIPRWSVAPLLDSDVQVLLFFHPVTKKVVALKTTQGLLWCVPHWSWRSLTRRCS